MSLKKYKIFLEESNLSIPDLSKPSNPKDTKYGPLRGDILLGKIENDEEVKLKTGEEAEIEMEDGIDITDLNGNYDPSKSDNLKINKSRLKNAFVNSKSGEKYKLSDFVKTSEFSGGRGSSLGTTETKIVETIQAYVFAFKQKYSKNKNLMVRMFDSPEVLDKIASSGEAFGLEPVTPETILKYRPYFLTFIKTANKFINPRGVLHPLKVYNFHQISSKSRFVTALTDAYRRSSKNSFGKIINMAKWTPSDIWAVNIDLERQIIRALEKINTITDLNEFIDIHFGSQPSRCRDIIGISLKKISSRQENIIIVINKETERPRFEMDHIILSSNPFTKGLDIIVNRKSKQYPGKDKINVRSSTSNISNINIEIIGSSSRHGKCSLTQINSFLESSGFDQIPNFGELSKLTKKDLIKNVLSMYDDLLDSPSSEMRQGRDSKPSMSTLISKYQSMMLAKILISGKIRDPKMCNKCINSIMYYALSIENQYFTCPRYTRVVEYQ